MQAISVVSMSEKMMVSPSCCQLPPMWLQPSLPVTEPSSVSSSWVSSAPVQVPSGELDVCVPQPVASSASRHAVSRVIILQTVRMWWDLLLRVHPQPGAQTHHGPPCHHRHHICATHY